MPKRNYKRLSGHVLRNLRQVHDCATPEQRSEGLRWYTGANRSAAALARRYKITTRRAAGVIAALSPGLAWERNVSEAEKVISAHTAGEPLPMAGVYGMANVRKCKRILEGEEPLKVFSSANKTRAFYSTVNNPRSNAVVVDRHAASAAFNKRGTRGGSTVEAVPPALYRWLERHYRIAAERAGIKPHQFQAVVWCAWRQSTPGHEVAA